MNLHKICFKTAFWKLPGPILRAGHQPVAKLPSGSFLVSLCNLGAEMPKTVFWRLPGPVFCAGRRTKPKQHSGSFLGNSGPTLRAGARNSLKRATGMPLGPYSQTTR